MGACSGSQKRSIKRGEENTSQVTDIQPKPSNLQIEQNQVPIQDQSQGLQQNFNNSNNSQNLQSARNIQEQQQQQQPQRNLFPLQLEKSDGQLCILTARALNNNNDVNSSAAKLIIKNYHEYESNFIKIDPNKDNLIITQEQNNQNKEEQQENQFPSYQISTTQNYKVEESINQLKIEIQQNGDIIFESLFTTIEVQCLGCSHLMKSNFLSLPCQHNFHSKCLLVKLEEQIKSGKHLVKCICGHKIHTNFLRSIDLEDKLHLKAQLFRNQLTILFETYKDTIKFYDYSIKEFTDSLSKTDLLASFYPRDILYTSNLTPS